MEKSSKSNTSRSTKHSPSYENVFFLVLFSIAALDIISVSIYEAYQSARRLKLISICDTGYCYHIDPNSLVSTANVDAPQRFNALTQKLQYLKNLGVQTLILDEFEIRSTEPGSTDLEILQCLIKARNLGITTYMIISPKNYCKIRGYILVGVSGLVSTYGFNDIVPGGNDINCTVTLETLKDTLVKTRIPVNGLLLYYPLTLDQLTTPIQQENIQGFNYTVVLYDYELIRPENKYIYRTHTTTNIRDLNINLNQRLKKLVQTLVQPKSWIEAGIEFDDMDFVARFTSTDNQPIENNSFIKALKEFFTFRKENKKFQQSRHVRFGYTSTSVIAYKRQYQENSANSIDYYSIITVDNTEIVVSDIINQPNMKLTLIYKYPNVDSSGVTIGDVINPSDRLNFINHIAYIIQVEPENNS